jgi:hypothetical protein
MWLFVWLVAGVASVILLGLFWQGKHDRTVRVSQDRLHELIDKYGYRSEAEGRDVVACVQQGEYQKAIAILECGRIN